MKGYVQVYTGNGKGKTTTALGLAFRAIGAGYKVFIGQFTKGQSYSELNTFKRLSDQITAKQYGGGKFIKGKPSDDDIKMARKGFAEVKGIVQTNQYQVVILDEINIALYYELVSVQEVLDMIDHKHESVELILTGRYAKDEIIQRADLVTEMKEVKHYYQAGVPARVGIEK